jgi:hypothetical protein
MNALFAILGFHKNEVAETEFSRFFRKASAAKKKKVFLSVAKKAIEDQRKIMNNQ